MSRFLWFTVYMYTVSQKRPTFDFDAH